MATADEKDRVVVVHAKWSYTDEKILVGLMVDQVKKGNMPTTTFSNKAWQEIVDEFYKKRAISMGDNNSRPNLIR